MTKDQEERLVAAWEGVAHRIGDLNEILNRAITKQWPESKPVREAVISRLPTAEDKLKVQTGNTSGPVEDWLGEFDPDEEIGPREKAYLDSQRGAGQSKPPSGTKTAS